ADVDRVGAGRAAVVVLQVHVEVLARREGDTAVEVDRVVAGVAVDDQRGVERPVGVHRVDVHRVVAAARVDGQRVRRVGEGDALGQAGTDRHVLAGGVGEGDRLRAAVVGEDAVGDDEAVGDRVQAGVVDRPGEGAGQSNTAVGGIGE